MKEIIYDAVTKTLKKENATEIIAERILWYENKIKEKDEIIDNAVGRLEEDINFFLRDDSDVRTISIDVVKERYLSPIIEILKGKNK